MGTLTDQSVPIDLAVKNVDEISAAGYTGLVKTEDGKIYGAGWNEYGQVNSNGGNISVWTETTVPNEVSATNKIKYICASIRNSSMVLQDGSLWTVGANDNCQLGDGTSDNSVTYIKAKNTSNQELDNIIALGRNQQEFNESYFNLSCIDNNGRIYVSGNNAYAQMGKNAINSNYSLKSLEY